MSILYGTKINQLLPNIAPTGLLFADSYMDLYYVMEQLTTLRSDVVRQK